MTPNIGKGGFSSLRKKDVLRSSSEKRYRYTILLIYKHFENEFGCKTNIGQYILLSLHNLLVLYYGSS